MQKKVKKEKLHSVDFFILYYIILLLMYKILNIVFVLAVEK